MRTIDFGAYIGKNNQTWENDYAFRVWDDKTSNRFVWHRDIISIPGETMMEVESMPDFYGHQINIGRAEVMKHEFEYKNIISTVVQISFDGQTPQYYKKDLLIDEIRLNCLSYNSKLNLEEVIQKMFKDSFRHAFHEFKERLDSVKTREVLIEKQNKLKNGNKNRHQHL